MKTNLCLHAGGALAPREAIMAVTAPAATTTYTPLSHRAFIERIERVLGLENIAINQSQFALAKDGMRMFGLMELVMPNHPTVGYSNILGLRNSYDKSFAASVVIGSQVFVCDNLAFSGEISICRRHTPNLLRDLSWMIGETIAQLPLRFKAQGERYQAYQGQTLTDMQVHDAVIRAYDAGIVNVTDIRRVLGEWRGSQVKREDGEATIQYRHAEFAPRNVWSFFNGVTEVLKNADTKGNYRPNIWELPTQTQALHDLCDNLAGFASPVVDCASSVN